MASHKCIEIRLRLLNISLIPSSSRDSYNYYRKANTPAWKPFHTMVKTRMSPYSSSFVDESMRAALRGTMSRS